MSTNVCQSMNVKGVAVKATYQSNVWMGGKSDHIFYSTTKFWPSKCIKFGWGSRILAQWGSGSGSRVTYINHFGEKIKTSFGGKNSNCTNIFFLKKL